MNFKEWFQNEGHISARDRISMKQDYTDKELRKNINPGDLIHFGFDTKEGGKKVTRYGIVTLTDSNKAVVYQFDTDKYKEIPLEQLVYIIFTSIPQGILSKAQKSLSELFPPEQAPEIEYHTALKAIGGEFEDNLTQMPKALIKLTEKQLQKYKNKIPTGKAPMMSPNDLFAFLSKKDPEPDPIQFNFGPTAIDQPKEPEKQMSFARLLDIMKQTDPKPGGLAGRVGALADRVKSRPSTSTPLSLSDLRMTRQIKKPESIFDKIDSLE
jgi:hypothetical protein